MAKISPNSIIMLTVSLMLLGILLPIALTDLTSFTSTDSDVQTLVSSVLPIVAVIGVLIRYIPRSGSD